MLEPWLVAKHYVRGWFLIDLLSSLPLERIINSMGVLQSAKLLKMGKFFKVFKMLRIAKGKSSLGYLNQLIYANPSAFNDITSGSNPGCDTKGFPATEGW